MNQNPEQKARDQIAQLLVASGWVIQDKTKVHLSAGIGVAIRAYQTDVGPADYVLFVNKKPPLLKPSAVWQKWHSQTCHHRKA